jgi:hypothetical protein
MESDVKLASHAELYIDFEKLTPSDLSKIMTRLDRLYRSLSMQTRRTRAGIRPRPKPLEIVSVRSGSVGFDLLGDPLVLFLLGKLLDYAVGGITYDALKFVVRQLNPWPMSRKSKESLIEQANELQETFSKGNYQSAKFTYESPKGEKITVELTR